MSKRKHDDMVSLQDINDTGERNHDFSVSPKLSAGDVDARWDQAESSGEEAAGSSNPTPDQEVVEEIGQAIGITYQDDEPLRVGQKEHDRDVHRWELDPASADDYRERHHIRKEEGLRYEHYSRR